MVDGDLDVEGLSNAVSCSIISAAGMAIPKSKPKNLTRIVPWWTEECRQAIKQRNRAFRHLKRIHNVQSLIDYKQQQVVVRKAVKQAKKEYWRKFCDSIGRTTPIERVWGMIKKMKGNGKEYEYPMLVDGEKIITDSKEKAETIAKTLVKVHSTDNLRQEEKRWREETTRKYQFELEAGEEEEVLNTAFTRAELSCALRKLGKTSPGKDGICYTMLEKLTEKGQDVLLNKFEEEDEHQPGPKSKIASGPDWQKQPGRYEQQGQASEQLAPGPACEEPAVGPARQPASKRKRASGPAYERTELGPACVEPAVGPARQPASKRKRTSGPARQQEVTRSATEQPGIGSDCQQLENDNIWMSKDGRIEWSSCSRNEAPCLAANVIKMIPGPTRLAVTHAQDIKSSFDLFMTYPIKKIILDCSNLEGSRVFGERWKGLDETDLDAYFGVLILAGVFRSKGEATESLWHEETGRELFRSIMPLKTFKMLSRIIRFDDREDRPARRQRDKLAAIRTVWDKWVARLPLLYNPGPNVTVDEQLMPFRGRCPFRQYIPSKPAKYGIKIWVACDAASSYAWNLQVYTGKHTGGTPEKNQGMRVVLDMAQGLSGHNITCDNFFTSHQLGQELLKRKLTMLGTVRKNKTELPPQLLKTEERPVQSSKFAFTADTTLVSYVPKKGKNVVLMSTLHRDGRICGQDHQKPEMILDYNATKGGVANLDKLVTSYSCKRRTLQWPLVIFFDILDISAYNAFVIWMSLSPEWNRGKLQKRRLFLEELGKMLVRPQIVRRQHLPRSSVSAAIVRRIQEEDDGATSCQITEPAAVPENGASNKKKRCEVCGPKMDRKTRLA
ncbi:piggyBac transposable element-derived protein 4-like [Neoarius graeffei]|uniref:piggyBac transposable element-derived protein 4-like n=1 Tax=Neoarius graeffei TaxID=443677 RepID=UPI00298C4DA7|nr:piggyBac transposable element-derived protein 4-like [Neoarius graeffei]